MNFLFIALFLPLLRYSKAPLFCCISLVLFYVDFAGISFNDFDITLISSIVMAYGVFFFKRALMKCLFISASAVNFISCLSNYYYDYSSLNSVELSYAAYSVYLSFPYLMITIYLCIIAAIIRGNFERISSDINVLNCYCVRGFRYLHIHSNEKGTKEG